MAHEWTCLGRWERIICHCEADPCIAQALAATCPVCRVLGYVPEAPPSELVSEEAP